MGISAASLYPDRGAPALMFVKAKPRNHAYARGAFFMSRAASIDLPRIAAKPSAGEIARALLILTKPRLGLFSVLTSMAAYGAARSETDWTHAFLVFAGTAFSAAGALSLNHWWERDTDALMQRTRDRPLPRAIVSSGVALTWSVALSATGITVLWTKTSGLAAGFALATIVIYGLLYTPLKRRTRWATEIGSISGALPPLLGAAAAGNLRSPAAWNLFAILLFWQMPHFFAIGWKHRRDYRAARLPLLPAIDSDGTKTAWWSFGYTVALTIVSMVPIVYDAAGLIYLVGAAIGNAMMLRAAWRFAHRPSERDAQARRLFVTSIVYLPLMLLVIVVDAVVRAGS